MSTANLRLGRLLLMWLLALALGAEAKTPPSKGARKAAAKAVRKAPPKLAKAKATRKATRAPSRKRAAPAYPVDAPTVSDPLLPQEDNVQLDFVVVRTRDAKTGQVLSTKATLESPRE